MSEIRAEFLHLSSEMHAANRVGKPVGSPDAWAMREIARRALVELAGAEAKIRTLEAIGPLQREVSRQAHAITDVAVAGNESLLLEVIEQRERAEAAEDLAENRRLANEVVDAARIQERERAERLNDMLGMATAAAVDLTERMIAAELLAAELDKLGASSLSLGILQCNWEQLGRAHAYRAAGEALKSALHTESEARK